MALLVVIGLGSAVPVAGAEAEDGAGPGLGATGQLEWSTFIGASGDEQATAVVVDSSGEVYVGGWTSSNDFPTTSGAFDRTYDGGQDIFVSKLKADGTGLIWSTFIGSAGDDNVVSMSLDSNGDLFITGHATSTGFPTTPGCFDPTFNGDLDAVLMLLDSGNGALLYSTYFGGSSFDLAWGTVSPYGELVIAGETRSSDLPTTSGAYDRTHNGGTEDAFVAKFEPDGKTLLFSTYLGGYGSDECYIAPVVGAQGRVYCAGFTSSPDLPVTSGCYQVSLAGVQDFFVCSLDSTGSSLLAGTYLGGGDLEHARDLAVNPDGDVVVAGYSASSDFPTTGGSYDTSSNGDWDGVVAVLSPDLAGLGRSTYLGGSGEDSLTSMHMDGTGKIQVTGYTTSNDFPVQGSSYDVTRNGGRDAYLACLSADCAGLLNSTYLGGSSLDEGAVIDVGPTGDSYICGRVESSDFPVTSGSFDTSHNGGRDAYALRFNLTAGSAPPDGTDRDQDGVLDPEDAFPMNPYEYVDSDGDGMGDNLDPDADDDGVPDERDAFPQSPQEWRDADGDGVGDNADTDDDDDGVPDSGDAFPGNPTEFRDTDNDGIGDDLDPDDDNDGVDDDKEWQDGVEGMFDDMNAMLSLLRSSLSDDIAIARGSVLDELAGVNATLASDIRERMDTITARLGELNASLGSQLASLLEDSSGLEMWLQTVLAGLDRELSGSNRTHLGKLDAIINDVAVLDANLSQAQSELGQDVQDAHQGEMATSAVIAVLVAIVVVLSVLNLALLRRVRGSGRGGAPERGGSEGGAEG